jgi:hypothetical protein
MLIISAIACTAADTAGKYNKITIGLIIEEILILSLIEQQ